MPEVNGIHICRCSYCHDFKLSKTPSRIGHVATRFHSPRLNYAVVTFNGAERDDPIEACPGPNGYIVVYATDTEGKIHYCRNCNRRVCITVLSGNVVVQMRDTSEVFA